MLQSLYAITKTVESSKWLGHYKPPSSFNHKIYFLTNFKRLEIKVHDKNYIYIWKLQTFFLFWKNYRHIVSRGVISYVFQEFVINCPKVTLWKKLFWIHLKFFSKFSYFLVFYEFASISFRKPFKRFNSFQIPFRGELIRFKVKRNLPMILEKLFLESPYNG